jgi:3-dehydroquinate synthase
MKGNHKIKSIPSQAVFLGPVRHLFQDYLDLKGYTSIFVIIDENTARDCLPLLQADITAPFIPIQIVSGEENKTIASCTSVWSAFLHNGGDRQSLCINLGGGVIGDLGGFCAATFMRGMDFIQIPTTVLAMADASVGGKLGVDFEHAKNYVGLFQVPRLVWIDPIFLNTLPDRHIANGMAEVIKHGLIEDAEFFQSIVQQEKWASHDFDWIEVLLRSTEIKSEIVTRDQREHGERKKLNFGHTVGHAIESCFLEKKGDLLHGEAVIIGIIAEAYLSTQVCGLPEKELELISSALLNRYSKVSLDGLEYRNVVQKVHQDKKKRGGHVDYSLIRSIGQAVINQHVSDELIHDSLNYYQDL